MKTIVTSLLALTPLFGIAQNQVKGMDNYTPVKEHFSDIEKVYIPESDTYDYVVLDDRGMDSRVNMRDFLTVKNELYRIFSDNGYSGIPEGVVISGQRTKVSSDEDFVREVKRKNAFLMIRYEMGNYYVYVNFNDEFCGIAVTKEFID